MLRWRNAGFPEEPQKIKLHLEFDYEPNRGRRSRRGMGHFKNATKGSQLENIEYALIMS
jgi:hypothetical protein